MKWVGGVSRRHLRANCPKQINKSKQKNQKRACGGTDNQRNGCFIMGFFFLLFFSNQHTRMRILSASIKNVSQAVQPTSLPLRLTRPDIKSIFLSTYAITFFPPPPPPPPIPPPPHRSGWRNQDGGGAFRMCFQWSRNQVGDAIIVLSRNSQDTCRYYKS